MHAATVETVGGQVRDEIALTLGARSAALLGWKVIVMFVGECIIEDHV